MAATASFYWTLRYGATGSVIVVGSSGNSYGETVRENGAGTNGTLLNINFLSTDTGETIQPAGTVQIDYTLYPIRAGQNSFERWVRGKWDFGTATTKISGVKMWMSSGANPSTDGTLTIVSKVTSTYTAPATGSTAGASTAPTGTAGTPPGSPIAVTFAGAAQTTAAGYSDYVILQLQSTTSAPPGNMEVKTWTIQYDES